MAEIIGAGNAAYCPQWEDEYNKTKRRVSYIQGQRQKLDDLTREEAPSQRHNRNGPPLDI